MASDEVLLAFLQGMEELDHQPAVSTLAGDTPRPAEVKLEPAAEPCKGRKRGRQGTATATAAAASKKRVAGPESGGRSTMRWPRRKQELHDLRQQAQELEAYVDFLQLSRMPAQFLLASESHASSPTDEWKAMISNEQQRIRVAREENAALKARLQTLVNASGAMQETLNAASTQREQQLARNTAVARELHRQTTSPPPLNLSASAVFGQLERRVAARNHEIDTIWSEAQEPLASPCSELVRIHREVGEQPAVEFKGGRVLPFARDAVSSAFWQGMSCVDRPFARTAQRSEDSVAVDNRFMVAMEDDRSVELRMRYVAKRFVRPEGIVVLVESVTEWPDSFADTGTKTYTTRESGWAVVLRQNGVQSTRNGTGSSSHPTPCLLRFLTRLQPATLEGGSEGSPGTRELLHTRVMNDMVIPAYRELLHSRQQVVDNLLLDGARDKQSRRGFENEGDQ